MKWTYETCYNEAKKYTTKGEFREQSKKAYYIASKNGWLENYIWLVDARTKWTYEVCYEEAKKYTTGGEFNNGNCSCYEITRRNGWINDYTWLKRYTPRGTWNEKTCYNEAKKYSSKSEFQTNNPSAYNKAQKNGWLENYDWFEGNTLWTYELCYEEAKKCKSRGEFKTINQSAYHKSKKEGWIEDYYWFKKRPVSDIPEYVVYEYRNDTLNTVYVGLTRATRLKTRDKEHRNGRLKHGIRLYDTLYEFYANAGLDIPEVSILKDNLYASEAQYYEGFYINQYKNKGFNILNKTKAGSLGAVMRWTEDLCYEEAKKYTTVSSFIKANRSCYETARRNGWLKSYIGLYRERATKNTWSYEKCYEIAKTCKTSGEFYVLSRGAYTAANRNNWFPDYTWFEKERVKRKKTELSL